MIDPKTDITDKVLRHFFTLKKELNTKKTFENVVTGRLLELQLKNFKKQRGYYVIVEEELANRKQKKRISIDYKIEKWFIKNLLPQLYHRAHSETSFLFSDLLRINNLKDFLEKELTTEELKQKVLDVIDRFRSRKKTLNSKFYFLTKDPKAIVFLNKLCEISPLKRQNYLYEISSVTPQIVSKIFKLLEQYVINNKECEYKLVNNTIGSKKEQQKK